MREEQVKNVVKFLSHLKVRGSLLLFTDGLFSRSLSQKKRLTKRFGLCLYEEVGVIEQPLMQWLCRNL
ncbi:hypothetical protein C1H46_002554 [Malus baccata]|uniref:Uncharacterized protein n=1 Tax=Malus baccata TaxID=106549 RepID=A0A540NN14_MALBA|nr:hypothetical protein C1H46_002554 [Malus baccata]